MIKKIVTNVGIGLGLLALVFLIQLNGASLMFKTVNIWTLLYMVIIFVSLTWVLLRISRHRELRLVTNRLTPQMVLGAVLLVLILTASAIGLALFLPSEHGNNQFISHHFLSNDRRLVLVTFVTINLTGPALEELLFRGLILQFISKISHSAVIGLLISTALFTYLHNGQLFAPVYLLPGLGFGYLFFRTKNIGAAIICHQLVNILATIQLFL
ncbi:CPBP family intramembrane glutamic endopeptidase [Loigolactobacillus zhaoyuanensis]|uniref:Lysostaphin resistance A-like protein n=1 Tax=Loigolactobacillus zhaoyuanensis TaxID=2486017 RepID=A0ABW8UA17_9LACO